MIDNKELYSALFDLEKELKSLKTAKQQIEEVITVGGNVVVGFDGIKTKVDKHLDGINGMVNTHINTIKAGYEKKALSDEENLQEIIKKTVRHLDELNTKINVHIKDVKADYEKKIISFSNVINEIRIKNQNTIEQIKDNIDEFVEIEFKKSQEYKDELIVVTKSTLIEITNRIGENLSLVEQSFDNQNQQISHYIDRYNHLIDNVNELSAKIESVNFPSRLDKLDNTVSTIDIGIQNNKEKLDELDESIRNTIENLKIKFENEITSLQSDFNTSISSINSELSQNMNYLVEVKDSLNDFKELQKNLKIDKLFL